MQTNNQNDGCKRQKYSLFEISSLKSKTGTKIIFMNTSEVLNQQYTITSWGGAGQNSGYS